jgi:hypothetical protein
MAIMDQALVNGVTVFFPQSIKRVYKLEEGQAIAVPNGWEHTALVMTGSDIVGYCCIRHAKPFIGKVTIDPTH